MLESGALLAWVVSEDGRIEVCSVAHNTRPGYA